MDPEWRDTDVYDLVTQLIKHTLRINRSDNESSYIPASGDVKIIKSLRSKAYEILLNKSNKVHESENAAISKIDPLLEILKHAFVLKLSLKRISQAEELENLINDLYTWEDNAVVAIYPILQLLIQLKTFQMDTKPILDVFHYGKINPLLPENIVPANSVPMYQTYPMETFLLSERFAAMLGISRSYSKRNTSAKFINTVSFEDQCISKAVIGIKAVSYNGIMEVAPCISASTEYTAQQCGIITPLLTHIMVDVGQTDRLDLSTQGFISNMTLPYGWTKPAENQNENSLHACMLDNTNHDLTNELRHIKSNASNKDSTLIWKGIEQPGRCSISKLQTWESLGETEPSKQALFVTDLPETILHLARIRQTSILSLLPKKTVDSISLIRKVSFEQFLLDTKLLLLGIGSDSFKYDSVTGYKLEDNIMVHGITSEALAITCREAIYWGNSFKTLSHLVISDPQTGKLQQDGVIFKAMCTNVKELLLYYQAALQRIFNQNEFHGLLNLFKKVRPLAHLIVEVTRLCDFNKNNSAVRGGSGILTHIYKEVTKVTNPKVALVFYSILKSCCEVYFQLLQNWLFEGTSNDVYGEFMIQARSQYLRKRGRRFWTESFAINTELVPGFLRDLSESILQCGKTLRLLKICSPKNPVCSVSITAQPEVRVCLSVSMLRDQLLRCQEYEHKGELALGPVVSILSAIQAEKKAEKDTADLVIRAQQETLSRINREREELIVKIAQNKRDLLQTLKNQAEESALFKEKEKETEVLADKLLLERINREQEEIREQQQVERERLVSYYDKLAADIENNRIRSNWRKARMNHFERRAEFLEATKRLDRMTLENVVASNAEENIADTDERNKNVPVSLSTDIPTCEKELISSQDENSNFAQERILDTAAIIVSNDISPRDDLLPNEVSCVDSDIPSEYDEDHQIDPENRNSDEAVVRQCDEDIVRDKKITIDINSSTVVDIENTHLSQQSVPLSYIHKQNNERSNLQDFLRDEAMKNIHTIMNAGSKQTVKSTTYDNHLNNMLKTGDIGYKKIIGAIDRPKSLAIEKIDNITQAQANKLRVLMQEYDMTPNNNEFNTSNINKHRQNIDSTNIIGNNYTLLSEHDEHNSENTIKNTNNNVQLTFNSKLLEETTVIGKPMNNEEPLNKDNTNNKVHEAIPNHSQQNNLDTPMSCTTDNFTTLSIQSPLSQIQNNDDVFVSSADREISSLSDTVKSITEETYFESPTSNFKLPNLFGASPELKSITTSSLTIADVEMIDHTSLHVYLEKSIIIPLQIQSRLINNAVIKYLLNERNMLLHLHSLRSYFFLLNGEFAKSLTDSLYSRLYTISAPIELFNSATLTNLLEKALMNSFSNNYANSELLSLSAIDKPSQLYISDPNVLECLCLNYKISWPLNIILDDTMMVQYSKVFKFLIMTGRMSWVLQEDFNIMKTERNAVISEQYHKLQLYRHSMTQFMNALHNYLTCSVLHASWSEFEKDLQNSLTIDQIYLSHMNYIKRILSRCMLNTKGERMRVCLINMFKIILKFHNRLRSQTWTIGRTGRYNHPNFKSLEQMYQSFCEWRTYMAHVAHKLTTSGYQPHLAHFLNALNINHMYDLTTKQ